MSVRLIASGLVVLAIGGLSGCGGEGEDQTNAAKASAARLHAEHLKRIALERKLAKARAAQPEPEAPAPATSEGSSGSSSGGLLGASAQASFDSLANAISGEVGLSVEPLGKGGPATFGPLQIGHAWSSIKVPIIVALIRDRNGALSSSERSSAEAAITASDNEAAARLFEKLERLHGGLAGASAAVQEVLAAAGDTETTVATAPPPPGAVSTYGQTEWSLAGATTFYRALANGCLVSQGDTDWILGLMENVIPEQRWGLGEAGFNASVGMKGGWGPESDTGGYLVRQSGFVRNGTTGVVVTLAAKDSSGSYEAGARDLTQVAVWLQENLSGLGSASSGCH